jgi:hypothetical protein
MADMKSIDTVLLKTHFILLFVRFLISWTRTEVNPDSEHWCHHMHCKTVYGIVFIG